MASSFVVYDDFYSFDPNSFEAVYIHNDKDTRVIGGHSVEIVGWGITTTKIPFWWIKNSWGKTFGKHGYFRFLRGSDHCSIESNVISCIPNFFMDFFDPQVVAQFYSKIIENTVFSINSDSSLPLIKSLSKKVLDSFSFNSYIINNEMYDDAFDKYGIFTNDVITSLGYLNASFPIKESGYSSINIRYMPGLLYKHNKSSDSSYDFLFSPSFFAGFPTEKKKIVPSRFPLIILSSFLFIILVLLFFSKNDYI